MRFVAGCSTRPDEFTRKAIEVLNSIARLVDVLQPEDLTMDVGDVEGYPEIKAMADEARLLVATTTPTVRTITAISERGSRRSVGIRMLDQSDREASAARLRWLPLPVQRPCRHVVSDVASSGVSTETAVRRGGSATAPKGGCPGPIGPEI